jgi:hypothetical protein
MSQTNTDPYSVITVRIQTYYPPENLSEVNLNKGDPLEIGGTTLIVDDVTYHRNTHGWIATITGVFK